MEFNLINMKNLLSSLLVLLLTFNSFAQKMDFINAPLNPVPNYSTVAQNNLKGNVFQSDYINFTRDGERLLSDEAEKKKDVIEFDAKKRIAKISTSYGSITTYTYDLKNRVIKEDYRHQHENWTKDYTYTQVKDVLIVTEKKMAVKRPYEIERHFKNGLTIQSQIKGKAPRKYHYEFDNKGNWIKSLATDINNKTLIDEVSTRDIIYYDEYDQGLNAISVVSQSFVSVLIVPKVYINNKLYRTPIARFENGFIFYDAFSKTYYIAAEGYNSKNTVGQKHTVEKLSTGHKVVMLYDGKSMKIVENGIQDSDQKWEAINYLNFTIATDSISKKSFAFGPFPKKSDTKIIALGGKNMLADDNKVSYLLNHEKKTLFVFENGKSIPITSAAVLEGDLSMVMIVNGTPKFVTPPDKSRVENAITPARYFDPAKDKILTKKATPTTKQQTNESAIATTSPSANNNTGSNSSLSTDSKNYLSVYKNNPEGVKEHLAAVYNAMLQKKYPPTMISGLFAIMSKEVFAINEDAAFALLMKMPTEVGVRDVLSSLPKDMREVIGKRARAKVATYAN